MKIELPLSPKSLQPVIDVAVSGNNSSETIKAMIAFGANKVYWTDTSDKLKNISKKELTQSGSSEYFEREPSGCYVGCVDIAIGSMDNNINFIDVPVTCQTNIDYRYYQIILPASLFTKFDVSFLAKRENEESGRFVLCGSDDRYYKIVAGLKDIISDMVVLNHDVDTTEDKITAELIQTFGVKWEEDKVKQDLSRYASIHNLTVQDAVLCLLELLPDATRNQFTGKVSNAVLAWYAIKFMQNSGQLDYFK